MMQARVKSQLRRYTQLNPQSGAGNQVKNEISIKGLTINKDNHKVTVYGEEIKLTPIEFDILYLLASHPGRVFSTDEILKKYGMRRYMRPIIPLWYISVGFVAR